MVDGYSLQDNTLIIAGAILTALIAVFADLILGFIERRITPKGLREQTFVASEEEEIPEAAPA